MREKNLTRTYSTAADDNDDDQKKNYLGIAEF